ncbi:hypothetical protein GCM10007916_36740 [Psychromonas marina]|uniref:Type II secretion system protein H n=1 Tax=Psychromonas marina TaxID=88364 RepID=A0ABQ6E581_9GAMM|nr:GspH/FimT family pseudopilin [Psychromonas marina]GLS92602.1 hypothetical protein GCM10007916_36740 [Psychromonas marina]
MKKSGFTVIELLVTLSILAIVLAIGVPNFKSFIDNGNMVSNANGVIGAFNYARIEAIKRGSTVHLQPKGDGWQSGIIVWADSRDDSEIKDVIRMWPSFAGEGTVNSTNSAFAFRATGEVDKSDKLTLCIDNSGEQGMQISILISGAVIAKKVGCA